MDDSEDGCGFWEGDFACRSGGFLYDAGSGEGYDPQDETYICPRCRTKDFLLGAKEGAETTSYYCKNGRIGSGLDIWISCEMRAIAANEKEALIAMREIGTVEALVKNDSFRGYEIVFCNTQTLDLS